MQETAFFSKTYDEAMALLVEVRDYLAFREPLDRETLVPVDRLQLCCETMRLTARMTQIMAWLLAQRAVHSGEVSQAEALAEHKALAELEVCMGAEAPAVAALPQRVQNLLERSHRLYVRVARLDELARRQLA